MKGKLEVDFAGADREVSREFGCVLNEGRSGEGRGGEKGGFEGVLNGQFGKRVLNVLRRF